jgi:hypothetical protein
MIIASPVFNWEPLDCDNEHGPMEWRSTTITPGQRSLWVVERFRCKECGRKRARQTYKDSVELTPG